MADVKGLELAIEVVRWAKTPGAHGMNPYFYPMVRRARAALAAVGMSEDDVAPAADFRELTSNEYARTHGIKIPSYRHRGGKVDKTAF